MELGLGHSLEQKQTLSQAQIQSLEILSMETAALEAFLQKEYLENPMLEHVEGGISIPAPPAASPEKDGGEDNRQARELPSPETEGLCWYLLSQLPETPEVKALRPLLNYLIRCLDDSGFFPMTAAEAARQTPWSLEQVEQGLGWLRDLEPWGIFAADLRQCLLKQLEMAGEKGSDLWKVVDCCLEEVAAGKTQVISRKLKMPTSRVHQALRDLSKLNPRPAQGFFTGACQYILPDVVIYQEDGVLRPELNDSWIENYQISDHYMRMMRQARDPEVVAYFQKKLDRIRFVMNSIAHRRKTILAISQEILTRQLPFFKGNGCLTPMTMGQIAQALHIHTSTVSRAVRGKYIQYPGGTIEMKELFTSAVGNAVCEEVGSSGIKSRIEAWIQAEDPDRPLSDQALVDKMGQENIRISRRTVAKYREELGIPSSQERKWKK